MQTVADIIKNRIRAGVITQPELAALVGKERTSIHRYEKGAPVPEEIVQALANGLFPRDPEGVADFMRLWQQERDEGNPHAKQIILARSLASAEKAVNVKVDLEWNVRRDEIVEDDSIMLEMGMPEVIKKDFELELSATAAVLDKESNALIVTFHPDGTFSFGNHQRIKVDGRDMRTREAKFAFRKHWEEREIPMQGVFELVIRTIEISPLLNPAAYVNKTFALMPAGELDFCGLALTEAADIMENEKVDKLRLKQAWCEVYAVARRLKCHAQQAEQIPTLRMGLLHCVRECQKRVF